MTEHLAKAGGRSVPRAPEIRRSARPRHKAGPLAAGQARARVLKQGHGRIFTGEMQDGTPATLEWGDEFAAPAETAKAHEDRGLAEIIEG